MMGQTANSQDKTRQQYFLVCRAPHRLRRGFHGAAVGVALQLLNSLRSNLGAYGRTPKFIFRKVVGLIFRVSAPPFLTEVLRPGSAPQAHPAIKVASFSKVPSAHKSNGSQWSGPLREVPKYEFRCFT